MNILLLSPLGLWLRFRASVLGLLAARTSGWTQLTYLALAADAWADLGDFLWLTHLDPDWADGRAQQADLAREAWWSELERKAQLQTQKGMTP